MFSTYAVQLKALLLHKPVNYRKVVDTLKAFPAQSPGQSSDSASLADLYLLMADMLEHRPHVTRDALIRLNQLVRQVRNAARMDSQGDGLADLVVDLAGKEFPIARQWATLTGAAPNSSPEESLTIPCNAVQRVESTEATPHQDTTRDRTLADIAGTAFAPREQKSSLPANTEEATATSVSDGQGDKPASGLGLPIKHNAGQVTVTAKGRNIKARLTQSGSTGLKDSLGLPVKPKSDSESVTVSARAEARIASVEQSNGDVRSTMTEPQVSPKKHIKEAELPVTSTLASPPMNGEPSSIHRLTYVLTQYDLEHSYYDERDLQEYLGVGSAALTPSHAGKLFDSARNRVGATPQDAARLLLQAAKILYSRGSYQDEAFITYIAYYAQYTGRRFQRESPRKDTCAAEYFLESVRAMETHPLPLRGALGGTRRAALAGILTSLIYLHDPRFNADRSNPYERPLRHVFVDSANSLKALYGEREGHLKFLALVRDITIGLLRIRQINPNRMLEIVSASEAVQEDMLKWIREYSKHWFPEYQPAPSQSLSDLGADLQRKLEEADEALAAKITTYHGVTRENIETLSTNLAADLNTLPNHLHDLDRAHLINFRQFLRSVGEYYSAELFSYRRGSYEQARGLYDRLKSEIRANPTRLAIGMLLTALEQGWGILNADFATRKLQAEPRLKLFLLKDQMPLSVGSDGDKTVEIQLKVANEGDDSATEVQVELSVDSSAVGATLLGTFRSLRTMEGRRSKVFTTSILLTQSLPSLVLAAEVAYRYDGHPVVRPPYHLEIRHSNPTDLTRLVDGTSPPYSLDAIDDPDRLRGRDEELRQLDAWLKSPMRSPVVIHGQRRVGKSSVGKVFSKRVWSTQKDFVVCYFEWLLYANSPLWSILHSILEDQVVPRLRERLGKKKKAPPPPSVADMRQDPFGCFTRYLTVVRQQRPALRFLFVIDEFDAVAVTYQRGHIDRSFFLWLRGLMNLDGLRFVFLGGEGLPNILNEFGEELNRSVPIHIEHLDPGAALELVQQPVKGYLKFSPASLNRIFDYCDGNPYYSTWVAIKILDVMHAKQEGTVSIIDVEQAVEQLFSKSMDQSKFVHLWQKDDVHYAVLRAVADTCHAQSQGRSLFFTEFAPANLIKQSVSVKGMDEGIITSALDVLETRRVLRRKRLANGWAYSIQVGLFADWLIKRGSLELRGIGDLNPSVWEGDADIDTPSVLLGEDS